MTERERLIELIGGYTEDISARDIHSAEFDEQFADYLLANGVILSPVKVGDTVYVNPETWGGLSFVDYEYCFIYSKHFLVAEVVSIVKTRKQNLIKLKVYNSRNNTYEYSRYTISSIGKTVFLTREEAEKALEEMNK